MWDLIRRHPLAVGISVFGHLALLIVFIVGFSFPDEPVQQIGEPEPLKAVAVDENLVREEMDKLKRVEAEKQRKKKAVRETEERELKALKDKRKDEEQRLKQVEKKRKQEEQKRKQAEQKRKEETRKKAETEKKRKAEEVKLAKTREAEKKRKAEEQQRQAETRKKREAEEKRKAEAERKRKVEEARLQAEKDRIATLDAARATEEAEITSRAEKRRLAGMRAQYAELIRQTVERHWIQPSVLDPGVKCEVRATQSPGGFITSVSVEACSGGGEAFRRSVESAVLKSEPLPAPPDPALFDRELVFIFKPE